MELLDKREVCRLLGGSKPLHPSTIWRLVRSGKLAPPIKVSAQIRRWQRSAVEAFLAERRAS